MKLYKITDRFWNGSRMMYQFTAFCYADDVEDLNKYMDGVKAKNKADAEKHDGFPAYTYELEEVDPSTVKVGVLRKGSDDPEWRELLD